MTAGPTRWWSHIPCPRSGLRHWQHPVAGSRNCPGPPGAGAARARRGEQRQQTSGWFVGVIFKANRIARSLALSSSTCQLSPPPPPFPFPSAVISQQPPPSHASALAPPTLPCRLSDLQGFRGCEAPAMAAPVVDAEYLRQVDRARRHLRALISNKGCAPIMLRLAYVHTPITHPPHALVYSPGPPNYCWLFPPAALLPLIGMGIPGLLNPWWLSL